MTNIITFTRQKKSSRISSAQNQKLVYASVLSLFVLLVDKLGQTQLFLETFFQKTFKIANISPILKFFSSKNISNNFTFTQPNNSQLKEFHWASASYGFYLELLPAHMFSICYKKLLEISDFKFFLQINGVEKHSYWKEKLFSHEWGPLNRFMENSIQFRS